MRDEAGATFVTRSLSSAFAVRMVKATVATASTDAIGKSRFHDMSWKRDFPMASVLAVATVAFTIRTAKAELRDLVTKVAPASSRIATRRRTCSTRRSATDQSFAQPDARDQRFEARVGADGIEAVSYTHLRAH